MENNCVFCKIAKGEIQDLRIWENKDFVAFLDINPFIKGHILVIPKKHFRFVWDMNDKEYCDYFLAVKEVAEILKKAFNTEIIQEVIAGLEVPHAHVHLLPRTLNDGFDEIPKEPLNPKPSDKEMKEIQDRIKKHL